MLWILALATSLLAAASGDGAALPPARSGASGAAVARPVRSGARGTRPAAPVVRPATVEEILAAVRASGSPAVLVNVWATWCVPCREEFPDLVRLQRTYRDRGLELVFVSADFDDRIAEVRRFLSRQGVGDSSYLKTGDDMHFINALDPRWTGALPASFIFDGAGHLRYFHEGKATYAGLEEQVLKLLSPVKQEPRKEDKS